MSVKPLNRLMVELAKGADTSTITIVNRQRAKRINLRLLKQITDALLVELKIESVELGISLVGAKEMAQVNWNFLRHEGSTDVITFDYTEKRKAESGKRKVRRLLRHGMSNLSESR